jgi:hypothetical protein
VGLKFEWNPTKAARNLQRHRVSFEEAATIFNDPFAATVADPDHSSDEDRFLIVGMSDRRRLLILSYAERGDRIRIISARTLTTYERQQYEEANQ